MTALRAPRLRDVALAILSESCPRDAIGDPAAALLAACGESMRRTGRTIAAIVEEALQRPAFEDQRLVALAGALALSRHELLAVALTAGVEEDALVGRAIAALQAPIGASRPTLGLIARTFAVALPTTAALLPALVTGAAVRAGLLVVGDEPLPLTERSVLIPTPLWLALSGHDSTWPATSIGLDDGAKIPLPENIVAEARRHAQVLHADPHGVLVLRSGSPAEGRTVAAAIARALGGRAAFIESDKLVGLGPWLSLLGLVPVFCHELAPGERRRLPAIAGYRGPVLALCGPDGSIDTPRGAAPDWILPVPSAPARKALWNAALGDAAGSETARLAATLATAHRHGAGRIAHLGRLARRQAVLAGRLTPEREDVIAAGWTDEGHGLESLAQAVRAPVTDESLVATPQLRADLDMLLLRCRYRERLVDALGPSARARYQPGVRALFTGPSGTGKTLGAAWIATRLGLPLYRVDLASVTSKYIGETEKNLSQLLARAEQADVILWFDDADSLFGKRTDISDSNDRFANAQTNYLLQRIEGYDGIVILTSNSQARFDEAFMRRLDCVVEFPAPGPEERRSLWLSHLGAKTTLESRDLNRLAVLLDLNGGHIRNVTLAAAVRARAQRRDIHFDDLVAGLEVELRKLGRQVPIELQEGRSRACPDVAHQT